ncbi:MAG: hypothetical protein NT157_05725 [Candidatus Micrarchaeota archaeon]|nr:hypothetical protein [Candidatus Micrarchaeota archaeon]
MAIDEAIYSRVLEKKNALDKLRPFDRGALARLQETFRVDLTYNSNAIEGNSLSLSETKLVLEEGLTVGGKSMREHLEATNHREALHLLGKIADRKAKVAECDVLALHAAILDRISPGNAGFYRSEQVFITQSRHMPPKWKDVPGLMKASGSLISIPSSTATAGPRGSLSTST